MIKLTNILLEFVEKDITKLRDYINSSVDERFDELVEEFGEDSIIYWFMHSNPGAGFLHIRECEDFECVRRVDEKLLDDIISFFKTQLEDYRENDKDGSNNLLDYFWSVELDHEYRPTWVYLTDAKIVRNDWMIHETFPGAVREIFKTGFKHGVSNYKKLGLTSWFEPTSFMKAGGGYNFAYTIQDFYKFGYSGSGLTYGDAFLVFRASGVTAYHVTDYERQTIFLGKTARDIVPVFYEDSRWVIYSKSGTVLYKTDALEDVPKWISKNYNQYRKSIGWEKPR